MSCGVKPPSAMVHANDTRGHETVWLNARLATLAPERPGLGVIEGGAITARGGRIAYAGSQDELPSALCNGARVVDCEGRWITPALIDCHTHLVYGGDRAHEFELRLAGSTYEEIAREGGGILSTVRATRAATEEELMQSALRRVDALIAEGVGTIEVKSGYGLDLAPSANRSASLAGSPISARSRSGRRSSARTRCRRNSPTTAPPMSPKSPTK